MPKSSVKPKRYEGLTAIKSLEKGPFFYGPPVEDTKMFDRLKKDCSPYFIRPMYRGKKLLRAKAAFADMKIKNGKIMVPEYKYPTSKQVKERPFIPVIEKLREKAREITGENPNHAIVTYYADGGVAIGPHHDKVIFPILFAFD